QMEIERLKKQLDNESSKKVKVSILETNMWDQVFQLLQPLLDFSFQVERDEKNIKVKTLQKYKSKLIQMGDTLNNYFHDITDWDIIELEEHDVHRVLVLIVKVEASFKSKELQTFLEQL